MNENNVNLRKKVISGTLWLSSLTFLGQLITWSVTLVVIRLLKPEDYGLMAMGTVFLGFLMILNEIGLGPAIIQKERIEDSDLRKAFGCIILINVSIMFLSMIAAPLIANFFSEPRVASIIRVLSLNFIFLSIYSVPQSLLRRHLEFRTKAIIDLIGNLISSAIVLTLALCGLGYWALIFGQIGMHAFKAIAFNTRRNLRQAPSFSLKGMREMLSFGGYVSLNRILWYFYSQADILIGGRIFGKQLLGIYSVAVQLVSIPMEKISPLISQIGFPAFSRIQNDLLAVQSNLLKLAWLLNTFSFPVFIGLAIVAPEAIPLLLGSKWSEVIVPIQLLSVVMPLRFIGILFGPVIVGKGRPEVMAGNMFCAIIIMPTAFLIGSRWGIIGLCYAWVVGYPILFFIMANRVLRILELPMTTFLGTAVVPFLSSSFMGLCLFLFKRTVCGLLSPIWSLSVMAILGAVLYCSAVLFFNRNTILEIRSILSTN